MTRRRDLRVVAGAIAVSAIGDWVAMIALGLRANHEWSGGGVAALLICLWSPLAILSGHVGVLVGRLPGGRRLPARLRRLARADAAPSGAARCRRRRLGSRRVRTDPTAGRRS